MEEEEKERNFLKRFDSRQWLLLKMFEFISYLYLSSIHHTIARKYVKAGTL